MKGEVGSCCHPPLSASKRWETIKPRPTAADVRAPGVGGEAASFASFSDGKQTAAAKRAAERAAEMRHIIDILHKWGIHTLGEFAALEKQDVSTRLGPLAVEMWERANGTATRLLKLVQPPESFAEEFEFENEIETSEQLLFMLQRFLEQLSARLSVLYFVAKELKLRITFSDKTTYEHLFKIPDPSNNVEVLFRMLQTHLETFRSEAPITAVALEAEPTKPAQQQFGLFETALRDPQQLSETLARLTGLLGAEHVGTAVLEDTHRPDAFRMEPFAWQLPEETAAVGTTSPEPIALRRFRPAATASVFLDGDQPAHMRSTDVEGDVVAQNGPFKLSGGWWDQQAWARAEWDVQLAGGAVCRCHEEAGAWRVDGIYD
jgi:protein ImuB